MGYACFDVEESDGIAHVRLSRGDKLNTMIPEFWYELPAIVDEISDSGRCRVLVLSSTGRHFTAGLDLSMFSDVTAASGPQSQAAGSSSQAAKPESAGSSSRAGGPEAGRVRAGVRLTLLAMQESLSSLERARMPVLAAVQGGCVGGGVDLVTAADCRYATVDAWFCIQEINIGMTADVGTLQRLPKLIPEGVAREYAYTGRRMGAARARELGLVNEVFDDHESMMDAVMGIAAEIASKSPLAVHGSKVALVHSRDHSVPESLDHIAGWQSGMFQPGDIMETFEAQSHGRAPVYDNLPEVPRGPAKT